MLLGVFMRALQMTIIAPSLVNIAQSIGASLADVGWIVAIYATGSLITQPIAGRLSDARSRRGVFAGAVLVFGAGSLVCALATSFPILMLGRVVQSLGAGGIQPAAIALIGQRVPAARQSAALYAVYGMFALAGGLGAVLGGALIDGGKALAAHAVLSPGLRAALALYPWHLIFWINLPLAAITVVLGLRLPADESPREKLTLDWGAMGLIALTAVSLMFAASGSARGAIGWIAVAAASMILLALWERRARAPFIDPQLFSSPGPALVYALAFLSGIPIFSITIFGAAYYIAQFHASAAASGLALLALAVPLGLAQGIGGRSAGTRDLRTLLLAGIVVLAGGELALALVHSMPGVLAGFALAGFGIGLASAPPNALVLRYVAPQRSGAATGVMTMLSSTGAITAPAVVSAFLHYSRLPAAASFRLDFLLAFAILAVCIPIAAALPRPAATS